MEDSRPRRQRFLETEATTFEKEDGANTMTVLVG